MRETKTHIYFWGTWFSQWAEGEFTVEGVKYNCAEQYMMAEKAKTFEDTESLAKIMNLKDPQKQKAIGRKVKNYVDEVWKEKRYQVVKKANLAKANLNFTFLSYNSCNISLIALDVIRLLVQICTFVGNPQYIMTTNVQQGWKNNEYFNPTCTGLF